ncbi:MAG TPA: DNA alkylation repair protein, partial [Symbiobacteriaceae bacterium]|nr:DNA alkylation repair protein [Symbiobacteriaceae bacterium]
MEFGAVMQRLESLGTEQARKTYRRHCIGLSTFGTSFGDMRKLAKEIKKDHALALDLWATGIFEAQVVATMIADPKLLTLAEAEAWVSGMTTHALTDELVNNLLVKAPYADEQALVWIDSDREFVGRAGWHLVGGAAKAGRDRLDYAGLLGKIEREIHGAPNRKREAMNNAL